MKISTEFIEGYQEKFIVFDGKFYFNEIDSLLQLGRDLYNSGGTITLGEKTFPEKHSFLWRSRWIGDEHRDFYQTLQETLALKLTSEFQKLQNEVEENEEYRKKRPNKKRSDSSNASKPKDLQCDYLARHFYDVDDGILKRIPELGWGVSFIQFVARHISAKLDQIDELFASLSNSSYELRIRRLLSSAMMIAALFAGGLSIGFKVLPIILTIFATNFIFNYINDCVSDFPKEKWWEHKLTFLHIMPKWIFRDKKYHGPLELTVKNDPLTFESNFGEDQLIVSTKRYSGISHLIYHIIRVLTSDLQDYLSTTIMYMADHEMKFRFCPRVKRHGDVKKEWLRMSRMILSDHYGLVKIEDNVYNIRNRKDYQNFVKHFWKIAKTSSDSNCYIGSKERYETLEELTIQLPGYQTAVPEHLRAKSCKVSDFDSCTDIYNDIIESNNNPNILSNFTRKTCSQHAGIVKIKGNRFNLACEQEYNGFVNTLFEKSDESKKTCGKYEDSVPLRYRAR
jgi:hypothetical protein